MKYVVIAPIASDLPKVMNALSQYEMKEAILVYHKNHKLLAENTSKELEKKGIPSTLKEIRGDYWEDAFQIVSETKKLVGENNMIVNLGTSGSTCKCIMMTAAFVNGLKAVDITSTGDKFMFPMMKLSYYKILSGKKMELLKLLYGTNCCDSMEELSKRAKMSMPLISYHVNGNLKSQGLVEMGLIETHQINGKTKISLSILGRLAVKELIDIPKE